LIDLVARSLPSPDTHPDKKKLFSVHDFFRYAEFEGTYHHHHPTCPSYSAITKNALCTVTSFVNQYWPKVDLYPFPFDSLDLEYLLAKLYLSLNNIIVVS
jgi:hypothetical protein